MLTPLSDDRKWPHGHSVAIDGERRSVGTARPLRPIKGNAELLSIAVPIRRAEPPSSATALPLVFFSMPI